MDFVDVTFSPAFGPVEGCTYRSRVYIPLKDSNGEKISEEIYAATLMAYNQNLTVNFGLNGCSPDGKIPEAYRIILE